MEDNRKGAADYEMDGKAYSFRKPRRTDCGEMTFQTHTHEYTSSTKLAEEDDDRHNHRVSGVTSEAIPIPGGNHVHAIKDNTDFFDHHHEIAVTTGPAIVLNPRAPMAEQKHVHLVQGFTTEVDDHVHAFDFATLIQAPLLPLEEFKPCK